MSESKKEKMIKKKTFYLIVILFTILMDHVYCQSELITLKSNKHLTYTLFEGQSFHSVFWNTMNDSLIFFKQYDVDQNFKDVDKIGFNYVFKENIIELYGKLYGEKYITINGKAFSNPMLIAEDLKEVKERYIIKGVTCKLYKGKIKENKYIAVYTANFKDGINYNNAMHKFFSNIKMPMLKKGEIVLLIGMMEGDKLKTIYHEFIKSEDSSEEMILNKNKLIESCNEEEYDEPNLIEKDFPRPVYCRISRSLQNYSPKVNEKITNLISRTCFFFSQYGEDIENEDFQNIFQTEVDKEIFRYKKNRFLNEKEIIQFEKELSRFKQLNQKKNFI